MKCVCCSLSYIIIYNHYFITLAAVKIVHDGAKSGITYSGYDPDDWVCFIISADTRYVQWKHNNSTVRIIFLLGLDLLLLRMQEHILVKYFLRAVFPESCDKQYNDHNCNITALNNDYSCYYWYVSSFYNKMSVYIQ